MPRKTKDKVDEHDVIDVKKASTKQSVKKEPKAKVATQRTTKEKSPKTETVAAKKTVKKEKTKTTAVAKKTEKKESPKTTTVAKKTSKKENSKTKAAVSKQTTKKSNSKSKEPLSTKKTKTEATKTSVASKRKKTSKKSTAVSTPPIQIVEYYDLPYKYGNTIIRLLAQTPKTLFVYWEVSDSDIENFKNKYGDDFFKKTKPLLVVHNLTLNKTTEIEINDFANCWYLNTDDPDCNYDIELVRKFIEPNSKLAESNFEDNYLFIAKSNDLHSPNDHILFEKIKESVIFKDVNSGTIISRSIKSFDFLKNIYQFYKDMYDEEILNNPSSHFML